MSQDSLQLEYAPPPAGSSRRVTRRWLLVALILVAAWAAVNWVPPTVALARSKWVQSRCATFAYPPGTVVYDSDPAARDRLLADSGDYVALDDTTIWQARAVARREPGCWTTLKTDLFGQRQFWPPGPAAPKAMVHRLRSPGGVERLVAIIVAPDLPGRVSRRAFTPEDLSAPPPDPKMLGVVAALIRPGDGGALPRWDGNGTFLRANFDPRRRLRFYAASVDPKDPARFSLRYEMDGQGGTVDGTFQDDGDVVMTVRDGPAKITP